MLTKGGALSSTWIFDYQEKYIDILYQWGLHRKVFMKINTIFNAHMLYKQYSLLCTESEFLKTNMFDFWCLLFSYSL